MKLLEAARAAGQPMSTMPQQNPHVMICTPCQTSHVDLQYHLSLMKAGVHMAKHGVSFTTDYCLGMTIDGARSMMATTFLRDMPDCTHLLFIDSDMAFASDLPYRMLRENVDILAVPYRRKQTKELFNVRHAVRVKTMPNRPHLIAVDNIATGMMLIRRNVFEKLALTVPEYRRNDRGETDLLFFRHDLVDDEMVGGIAYMGEDYHFCKIAREAGYDIWAYIDEDIAHVGAYAYRGNYREFAEKGYESGKYKCPDEHEPLKMLLL